MIKAYNHELEVMSLRDTSARCSCGRWNMTSTTTDEEPDNAIRAKIMVSFATHLESEASAIKAEATSIR